MKTSVLDFLDHGRRRKASDRLWLVDGAVSWSLGEFDDLSRRIGSALISHGVAALTPVPVFLPNGGSMLAADFGVMRAGAAFLNLDITLPVERLRGLLAKVDPPLVVADAHSEGLLRAAYAGAIVRIEDLAKHDVDADVLDARRAGMTDCDPACLITTSGSTGVPKAVALSHRGLIDFGDWFDATFSFSEDDIVGSLSPLFFDGYIPGLLMSLYHGGRFVILPREYAAFPIRLIEELCKHRVSFIFWVPSTLTPLANLKALDRRSLPELKFVGFAGEVMPSVTLAYLREHLPEATFVNFYGPIEISVICTYFVVPDDFQTDAPLPIGKACANSGVLILDEQDRPCDVGEHGELCVRGSGVALGYWNDPEKTLERFVVNPLVPGYREIIYRTGDIAFRDGKGLINFVGRRDFQIKHQGYRIDLAEIEHVIGTAFGTSVLCALYDSARKHIVVVYDDPRDFGLPDIRRAIADKLPKYMHPHVVRKCTPMPLNANGKIDRLALRQRFLQPEEI